MLRGDAEAGMVVMGDCMGQWTNAYTGQWVTTTSATADVSNYVLMGTWPQQEAPSTPPAPVDSRSKNERWLDERIDEIRVSL